MRTRVIVGLTALAVVVGITFIGGIPFLLLALACGLVGGYEFYWMLTQGNMRPEMILGLVWLVLLALGGWQPTWFPSQVIVTLGFFAIFIRALTLPEQPLTTVLATAVPAIYMGLMMAEGIGLRYLDNGFWWIGLAFAIAWGNDTAAYFAGVTLGKHKIWPRLSPKKTWEGTVSGWIFAGFISVVIVWLTPLNFSLILAAVLGLVGGVLGFFGDLSISMVKRQVGVKDSGHFFPGHGGMLDRLDSMLFVIPYVYLFAIYIIHAQ